MHLSARRTLCSSDFLLSIFFVDVVTERTWLCVLFLERFSKMRHNDVSSTVLVIFSLSHLQAFPLLLGQVLNADIIWVDGCW